MIKQWKSGIGFYQAENLLEQPGIGHFFSTKDSDFEQVQKLAETFNLEYSSIIIGKQTHSDQIALICQENTMDQFNAIDAFITNEKGICVAVKTADCTPVLLYDPILKVIAAIHSGWRGTIQNISGKTIARMMEKYHVQSQNIIAAIGPCIGQQHYEVGEEVAVLFRTLFSPNSKVVEEPSLPGDQTKISVRHAIFQQLINAGLHANNIEISEVCTYNDPADFHSARRDGASTGRMINGIWLK